MPIRVKTVDNKNSKICKRVLVLGQFIEQSYINVLSEALGNNAEIDVISGSELVGNNIHWIQSPKHNPASIMSRFECWLTFYKFVCSWAKKTDRKYNLIYAVSNPPINSYIGLKLKAKFHAPFVYMNWDLYPQLIETAFKSFLVNVLCGFWRAWNVEHYPQIDCMLTIGEKMADSVRASTGGEISLSIVPICVDSNALVPIDKKKNSFLINHHLEKKFNVLFSGKMGMGHNIEIILNAAHKLRHIDNIMFVFIGNGPKFSTVEEYIKINTPPNMRLFPWQDKTIYPYSIACGDIAIVTEEKAAEGLMLPSRVFSMMSCGEAIIGICGKNDDLYSIVEKNKIGVCVTDDNVDTLVKGIMSYYEDRELLVSTQRRARKLVEEQYNTIHIVREYRRLFERFMNNSPKTEIGD